MRPRSQYPPMTPAERQAKRRAIKRGTYYNCQIVPCDRPPALPPPPSGPAAPQLPGPVAMTAVPPPAALPAPAPAASPSPAHRALPSTALQKAAAPAVPLSVPGAGGAGDASRLYLPAAVAARLQSLLDRHHAGHKPLTAAERAEAEGLLDIAEFFVVQRMRHRLAA